MSFTALVESNSNKPSFMKDSLNTTMEWLEKGNALTKDFEEYKDTIARTIEINLNAVDELPPLRFGKNDIKQHFKKLLEEQLKKDERLEKSVEIKKYCKSFNQYIVSYYEEIFKYHDKIRDDTTSWMIGASRIYFNSDLPISFLKIYEDACLAQKDYLDVFDRKIKQERMKLFSYRSNRRKFDALCDEHNRWIEPFGKKLNQVEHEQVNIMWYIDLANCEKIEDFDKPKTIHYCNLDASAFNQQLENLQKLVIESKALMRPYREFKPISSYTDSSARVIRNIMELL
jgi:hypothetical protein